MTLMLPWCEWHIDVILSEEQSRGEPHDRRKDGSAENEAMSAQNEVVAYYSHS